MTRPLVVLALLTLFIASACAAPSPQRRQFDEFNQHVSRFTESLLVDLRKMDQTAPGDAPEWARGIAARIDAERAGLFESQKPAPCYEEGYTALAKALLVEVRAGLSSMINNGMDARTREWVQHGTEQVADAVERLSRSDCGS